MLNHLYHPYNHTANVAVPIVKILSVTPVWKHPVINARADGWIFNEERVSSEFIYYFTIMLEGRETPLRVIQPYDSEELQLTDEGAYERVREERDRTLDVLNNYWAKVMMAARSDSIGNRGNQEAK